MTIMADRLTVTFAVTAPTRCNNAGFCRFCDVRGCLSAACVTMHAASWWALCDRCDGSGWFFGLDRCRCVDGVVQVEADHPGAVCA
jgi:hypothetical protein